jgi:hypothetical protein
VKDSGGHATKGAHELKRTSLVDVHHTLREIAAIPHEALPYGSLAREALMTLAHAGCELAVYEHWYSGAPEWMIWLRPAWPWQDGRYTLDEWTRDYAQLAGEALARQARKDGEVA